MVSHPYSCPTTLASHAASVPYTQLHLQTHKAAESHTFTFSYVCNPNLVTCVFSYLMRSEVSSTLLSFSGNRENVLAFSLLVLKTSTDNYWLPCFCSLQCEDLNHGPFCVRVQESSI